MQRSDLHHRLLAAHEKGDGAALIALYIEAAEHALRPLAVACGIALGLALLLRLTVFRRRRGTPPAPEDVPASS